MANAKFNKTKKQNCENAYKEISDLDYIYNQVDDNFSTTLSLRAIVPLCDGPECKRYLKAVLEVWRDFQHKLDSINEIYVEEVEANNCFDVEDGCEDEAEFDSYDWFHHFDDADWEE